MAAAEEEPAVVAYACEVLPTENTMKMKLQELSTAYIAGHLLKTDYENMKTTIVIGWLEDKFLGFNDKLEELKEATASNLLTNTEYEKFKSMLVSSFLGSCNKRDTKREKQILAAKTELQLAEENLHLLELQLKEIMPSSWRTYAAGGAGVAAFVASGPFCWWMGSALLGASYLSHQKDESEASDMLTDIQSGQKMKRESLIKKLQPLIVDGRVKVIHAKARYDAAMGKKDNQNNIVGVLGEKVRERVRELLES